jgi:phage-related protein
MGVASGIGHLFESIGEMIQGIFAFFFHAFQFVLNSIVDVSQFVLSSIVGVFNGFVNFVEGTLGFAFREY